jgi:hypothetical protein
MDARMVTTVFLGMSFRHGSSEIGGVDLPTNSRTFQSPLVLRGWFDRRDSFLSVVPVKFQYSRKSKSNG